MAGGASYHCLETMRKRQILIPVARGIDRLRDHPFDLFSRWQAALDMAGPESVLGLRSAARLHDFYMYRGCEAIEVVVDRQIDARTRIGRVVRTRSLPPNHVTTVDGFPVTTVARTFFDLCGDPDPELRRPGGHPVHDQRMAKVCNDALARRGLTFVKEAAVLAAIGKRGRAGTRLVRELLLRFGPNYVPTRSDTESLFMELVEAFGLPEPQKQVALSDSAGWIGTVDFLWPRPGVVVEVDSTWHDGPLDIAADAERDARLRAAGYRVERYRYRDLIERPEAIFQELGVAVRSYTELLHPERGR
jgi:hypothetical protein